MPKGKKIDFEASLNQLEQLVDHWRSRHSAQARITHHALPLHQPFKFHWRDEDDARQRSLERLERFRPAIHNFRFLGVACKRKAQRKNSPVSLISDRLLVLSILETHFDEENLAKYFFMSSGL